jgi:hypothetical protein
MKSVGDSVDIVHVKEDIILKLIIEQTGTNENILRESMDQLIEMKWL